MSTLFTDIYFKLIIDFSDLDNVPDYEVITGAVQKELPPFDPEHPDVPWTHAADSKVKFIRSLHLTDVAGCSGSNPIGHMASSNIYISVFDDKDTINPMNNNSIYANHMIPGRKITVLKSTDRTNWLPYFKGFVTNWQGSFNDGYYGDAQISAADMLNSIGQQDMTGVSYTGTTALQALQTIFENYGLTSNDYVIDSSLGLSSLACATLKSPARVTINDICDKSLARVAMKQNGKVYVEPLIIPVPASADHVLIPEDCGPVTPTNTNAVSYSKVKVTYTSADGLSYQKLASQTDIKLVNGLNTITLDTGSHDSASTTYAPKIHSVENINLTVNEESAPQEYTSITYKAGDTSVVVEVNAVLDGEKSASIDVYGLAVGGIQQKEAVVDIAGSSIGDQAATFTYNSSVLMTSITAAQLATKLANYITSLRKQIQLKQTSLSPDAEVGQTVELTGVSDTYDGVYVVSKTDFEYAETVNMGLTLLKLE